MKKNEIVLIITITALCSCAHAMQPENTEYSFEKEKFHKNKIFIPYTGIFQCHRTTKNINKWKSFTEQNNEQQYHHQDVTSNVHDEEKQPKQKTLIWVEQEKQEITPESVDIFFAECRSFAKKNQYKAENIIFKNTAIDNKEKIQMKDLGKREKNFSSFVYGEYLFLNEVQKELEKSPSLKKDFYLNMSFKNDFQTLQYKFFIEECKEMLDLLQQNLILVINTETDENKTKRVTEIYAFIVHFYEKQMGLITNQKQSLQFVLN